jgi:molecular chaperone DnaJ
VKVPAGTETGKQFRLRGKGMPVLRSKITGDLYVQVEVETPQNLSRRQKDLLKEFEKASTDSNHPETAGFLNKVKAFWDNMGKA